MYEWMYAGWVCLSATVMAHYLTIVPENAPEGPKTGGTPAGMLRGQQQE